MNSALKYHGAKSPLAKKIIDLFPSRGEWLHYVEPYFASGAVLFANDPEGISEVANDLNGDIANFWTVLRNPDLFPKFLRGLQATPFSQDLWKLAHDELEKNASSNDSFLAANEPVKRAWLFFINCRQSMAGRGENFTPLSRNRTRRDMNEQVSAWLTSIEGLPEVHKRLQRVVVLNDHALTVVRQQDGKKTLFYLDPTYLHETRSSTDTYGKFEMTDKDHLTLLETLATIEGKFLLSGYPSQMYTEFAERLGWRTHVFYVANHAASGKKKETKQETIWMNY